MKNYYMYFCRIKINTIFATLLKKSKGGVLEVPNCCVTFETVPNGRLAQLVQSICLTSRGSAVRIRQRPLNKAPIEICFSVGVFIVEQSGDFYTFTISD